MNTLLKYALFVCIALNAVLASDKVVIYWGQNSVGDEKDLRDYCASSSVDIVVMGFVYEFPTAPGSSYPGINFANHCWRTFDSADPYFLNCSDSIAPDITYCQSLGKKILLSFGGAVGTYGFKTTTEAQTFADTVWNMFLGGTSDKRPFGNAIIDGVDLDIEAGGSFGYAAFITQLRTHFTAQTSRTYTISGAPQCVYPDAMMGPGAGTALGEAWFDYVWVQFYNNYCGVNYYPSEFNFNVWANWAATISINPQVEVFIGAPGSQSAAGQGYVTAATLNTINTAVVATYPANYGGIMLWDAGTAYANGDFATQLAAFVHTTGSSTPVVSAPTTPVISTPTTPVVVSTPSTTAATPAPVPVHPVTPVQPITPASPATTAAAAKIIHATTTTTTGKAAKTTTTTGKAAKTTTTTTGRAKTTSTSSTTGAAPVVASSTSTSDSSLAGQACSNDGYMRCAGQSSYQTCSNGLWSVVQNCAANLKCSPSGDYIYCTY